MHIINKQRLLIHLVQINCFVSVFPRLLQILNVKLLHCYTFLLQIPESRYVYDYGSIQENHYKNVVICQDKPGKLTEKNSKNRTINKYEVKYLIKVCILSSSLLVLSPL